MLKRTPLFHIHQQLQGKCIDFGDWELPVQYEGIMKEHEAVREKAGLFDVSHMGEAFLLGDSAEESLQHLVTNDVSNLSVNQAMYAAMCYEDGGTVDDLLIYKMQENKFMLVLNASNTEKDVAWMKEHIRDGTRLIDVSEQTALLALQGPLASQILQKCTPTALEDISFFRFKQKVKVGSTEALLSRTGYTGEDGFEIYVPSEDAASLWNTIMHAGNEEGLQPCGLGARDSLRLEARLPLYGQELTKNISPLEAGIGFAVKTKKSEPFIGQQALIKQKENSLTRKIVGIEMTGRGIPRTGYAVYPSQAGADQKPIGYVTSGTHSPTLHKHLGLALLETAYTALDNELEVEIRGKRIPAHVVATPFYKRNKT